MLHSSAEKCGSVRYVKKSNSRVSRKRNGWNPWWNNDCEEKRTAFNKTRKKCNSAVTSDVSYRKSCSKSYKKAINKAIHDYNKDLHKKLRVMKSQNPKDYWNIINNKKQSTHCMDKVNPNLFYEHFQKLNSGAPEPCDFSYVQDSPDGPLNSEITENKVKTCINLLKNGKASGGDHVVNEFWKCLRDV